MIKIAICDNNIIDLSKTVEIIEEYRATKHLNCEYTIFHSGFELATAIEFNHQSFDIYCLDIVMPIFTGIDAAKTIRKFDKSAHIIFLTHSPEYALESYSVNAANYLLKPVSKDKLCIALDELFERMTIEEELCLIVKSSMGIEKLLVSNITYAEIIDKKVLYYLASGKIVKSNQHFCDVCNQLLHFPNYIKPHRSYIVNMMYIASIDALEITLQTGCVIPLPRGTIKKIKTQYLDYQMNK